MKRKSTMPQTHMCHPDREWVPSAVYTDKGHNYLLDKFRRIWSEQAARDTTAVPLKGRRK